ncbi:hypothetical protein JX266_000062 [Neoarthrinium moseri]|nr:hypothetical protein JX266_000062 [Neoarthrinium moseri]
MLEIRQSVTLPAVCYDICNNAYIEAQAAGGPNSAICQDGSSFKLLVETCHRCIQVNAPEPEQQLLQDQFITPVFQQWLDFCSSGSSSSRTPISTVLRTTTIDLGAGSSTTSISSVLIYALENITINARPATSTSLLPSNTSSINPSSQSTTSPLPTTSSIPTIITQPSRNPEWIAGPVIGSIGGVCLISICAWLWWRRRHKHANGTSATAVDDGPAEKAQLHGDSLPYSGPHELYGMPEPQEVENREIVPPAELPGHNGPEAGSTALMEAPVSPAGKELPAGS